MLKYKIINTVGTNQFFFKYNVDVSSPTSNSYHAMIEDAYTTNIYKKRRTTTYFSNKIVRRATMTSLVFTRYLDLTFSRGSLKNVIWPANVKSMSTKKSKSNQYTSNERG